MIFANLQYVKAGDSYNWSGDYHTCDQETNVVAWVGSMPHSNTKDAVRELAESIIGQRDIQILDKIDMGGSWEDIATGVSYNWQDITVDHDVVINCRWCGGGEYRVYVGRDKLNAIRVAKQASDDAKAKIAAEQAAKKIADDAREAAVFAEAKNTGEKQVLRRGICGCQGGETECSFDAYVEWAMPDGTTQTSYSHCY